MAVNQVSLSFYPPRWQPQCTRPHVVAAVRSEDSTGPVVNAAEVRAWLADRGFVPAGWGKGSVLEYGPVRSIFGPEKEIEVTVGEDGGEVTDVYCRFTLPKGPPPRLGRWAEFAGARCARFGLRLEAGGVAPCGEAEFRAAVRDNPNWQDFARHYSWDEGERSADPGVAPEK
jgi:hypothetical protein